jgi:hypothetical protein
MKFRVGPFVIVAAVLGAAGFSLFHSEGSNDPKKELAAVAPVADDPVSAPVLPPNHPPIDGTGSPHGLQNGMGGTQGGMQNAMAGMQGGMQNAQNPVGPASDEAPAVTWKVPPGWQTAPNPSAMRIATYHPAANTDVSVSRAGGSSDANIERWLGQFDDAGQDKHTEKVVRGLDVKLVEVSGTYAGGGMMPAAPSDPHRGWALVGAVVETPGSHYFFKMVGPAAQVRSARASFDAMIASLTPT